MATTGRSPRREPSSNHREPRHRRPHDVLSHRRGDKRGASELQERSPRRFAGGAGPPQTRRMSTPGTDPVDDRDVAPLGGATSPPPGDDDADGIAGPVYPPPETEPDAHGHSAGR